MVSTLSVLSSCASPEDRNARSRRPLVTKTLPPPPERRQIRNWASKIRCGCPSSIKPLISLESRMPAAVPAGKNQRLSVGFEVPKPGRSGAPTIPGLFRRRFSCPSRRCGPTVERDDFEQSRFASASASVFSRAVGLRSPTDAIASGRPAVARTHFEPISTRRDDRPLRSLSPPRHANGRPRQRSAARLSRA
jgi:hypothetical protein